MTAEVKTCPVCGAEVPRNARGRPRVNCSRRCTETAAWRAYKDRKRRGIPSSRAGFGCARLIDLTGQRFGSLVVVGPVRRTPGRTYWPCRCDCGATFDACGYHLRTGKTKRCFGCFAAALRGAAAKAPGAERGRCSWCRRPARRRQFECHACQKQAARRGRDATGRPLARGPRPVLGEPLRRQEVATA